MLKNKILLTYQIIIFISMTSLKGHLGKEMLQSASILAFTIDIVEEEN